MKILIAPDKFKGSLSANQVCDAIVNGIKINNDKHEIISCPMADGGEGSIDIINNYLSLMPVELIVNDPLFRPIKSTYYISDTTAYIEMSSASGLTLLKKEEQNCMYTSSYGTGELIKDAINKGLTTINLYIGGSATNDGGVGIASVIHQIAIQIVEASIAFALGFRLSGLKKNNTAKKARGPDIKPIFFELIFIF